jgi:hypothetical protein
VSERWDFVIVGGGSAGSAALDLPLEVREVGNPGLERALEALVG